MKMNELKSYVLENKKVIVVSIFLLVAVPLAIIYGRNAIINEAAEGFADAVTGQSDKFVTNEITEVYEMADDKSKVITTLGKEYILYGSECGDGFIKTKVFNRDAYVRTASLNLVYMVTI